MVGESIVEYFGAHEKYSCGYCKNSTSSCSTGMWAHYLTPQAYQDLINRGWRRSGKHCYKPTLNLTCCPQYTIRCEALNFKLSKSQKKVLKRMHKFLATGNIPSKSKDEVSSNNEADEPMDTCALNVPQPKISGFDENLDISVDHNDDKLQQLSSGNPVTEFSKCNESSLTPSTSHKENISTQSESGPRLKVSSGQGMDPTRPQCRKAKDIRRERRLQKLTEAGISPDKAFKKQKHEEKSLEDFLSEPFPTPPAHRLELRLIPSDLDSEAFGDTDDMSYSIYQKYQTTIHRDPPEKCSYSQYIRFLVTSPLQASEVNTNLRLGSYHQQYWLDDEIIAVGVIDILPYCVSSVYLYYDPKYYFLSLGTYTALREIALTRELHKVCPDLIYYYMGFYIHTCPKMRYKMAYSPSFLLCPETYTFHPIEKCVKKLEISKYQRFEEDCKKVDLNGVVHLNEVMILFRRQAMTYDIYRCMNQKARDEQEVKQYASLVGRKCYSQILLYRK